MKSFILSFIIVSTFMLNNILSQSIVGSWKTIDEDGNAKSIVKIFLSTDGKYYGKIIKIFDIKKQDALCEKCKDSKKNKPILGMQIISGLEKKDDEYSGGTILDPNNGKVYKCSMWIDSAGNLKVRGYIGVFYRTQTWTKI